MTKNSNTNLLKFIFFLEASVLLSLSFLFIVSFFISLKENKTTINFGGNTSQNNTAKRNTPELNAQLIRAAQDGNLDLIKQAIENGADVNATDEEGYTPLHRTIFGCYINEAKPSDLITDKERKQTRLNLREAVLYLLSKGADINAKNSKAGGTPLAYSLSADCEIISQILTTHGAKAEITAK